MSLAAIVLAAGAGARFGGDKLSASFRGEPLIAHAIRAARAAPVERVIVVCAPALEIGRWDSPGPPVDPLRLASMALSDSLKAGIAAAGAVEGAFVFLGDMPLAPHEVASLLVARLGTGFAALPRCQGRSGHPVLLSRRALAEAERLMGDAGAGQLLRTRTDVVHLECADHGVILDVDRAEDLARLEADPPGS